MLVLYRLLLLCKLLTCLLTILPGNIGTTPPPLELTLTVYPPDERVSIGKKLTIQCNVRNRISSGLGTVWLKDGRHFATDGAFYGRQRVLDIDRTTINKITLESIEIDTLTITNIQHSDQGNYTCQLWLFKKDVISETLFSESIDIKVLPSTATIRQMECSANATSVSVGEVITLVCEAELTEQRGNLFWTVEGSQTIYEGETTTDSASSYARMANYFVMNMEHNDKIFTCHMKLSSGAQSNFKSCSIGPFSLTRPTQIPRTSQETGSNTARSFNYSKDLTTFMGFIFIIVVIAGLFLVCCLSCLICYCCCCRMRDQGRYTFGALIRSEKGKSSASSPIGATDKTKLPYPPTAQTCFIEPPRYASIGPVTSGEVHAHVQLSSGGMSIADGASYTSLHKNDVANGIYEGLNPIITNSSDSIDNDGYNYVGIGNLVRKETPPSEVKLAEPSNSWQESRESVKNLSPVNEDLTCHKSISSTENGENNDMETPYYLTVFGAAEVDDEASKTEAQTINNMKETLSESTESNNDDDSKDIKEE